MTGSSTVEAKETTDALDRLLREIVASLNKVQLDVRTVSALLDERHVRDLAGDPLPGLADAVWTPLRAPTGPPAWHVVDARGHVRARLTPPSNGTGYKWAYRLEKTEAAPRGLEPRPGD